MNTIITPLLFVFLIVVSNVCCATDYYVSPNGTESWPNCTTIDTPCQASNTEKDFLSANPGDTVWFLDGVCIQVLNKEILQMPMKSQHGLPIILEHRTTL